METDNSIPESIAPVANSALRWINDEQGNNFELTGVVDYPSASQHQIQVKPTSWAWCCATVKYALANKLRWSSMRGSLRLAGLRRGHGDIPPLLDPPVGLRASWLDEQLAKFEFILLLFYRGRW